MIYHPHADGHPAATFGLIIGTLAVLTGVLVFAIYAHVDGARRTAHGLPPAAVHQQR
ncbi:MAG TPA: hypothetical protein VHA55_00040 [Pseudorhodoplanes sp.]|jgi:hypothetical protein|nr:hypothetical protein [Pseudorhodoplanes sp.]